MKTSGSGRARRIEALSAMLCTADGRRSLASELEAVLFRHALDAHWPATRDPDGLGFITGLDRRWRPVGAQNKSLEFQVRQTWAFARAARLYPGRGYEEPARVGFEFLTEKMWDAKAGGFFTLVDREGRPLERGRKHPHAHTYAVEGFLELVPLFGEAAALPWAMRAFEWLERVAWDEQHGGYWGYYERDNTRIISGSLVQDVRFDWLGTPIGLKDLNVLGDTLGAVSALAAWDRRARTRLEWHIELFIDRVLPRYELLPYLYFPDFTAMMDVPRAGEALQLVATLLTSAAQIGRLSDGLSAAKALAATCRTFFAEGNGGYCFARSVVPSPVAGANIKITDRCWWIQMEAVRGSLLLALLCPEEPRWRTAFARQWAFVESRLCDERYHGFFETAEDGDRARSWLPAKLQKTHIWKDVSHEAQFLMDAIEWLRNESGTIVADIQTEPHRRRETSEIGAPAR
jgi:mannose/cellobiose epimerase-like protein (N-acyl-D-glucosamine 2-epimerase family)